MTATAIAPGPKPSLLERLHLPAGARPARRSSRTSRAPTATSSPTGWRGEQLFLVNDPQLTQATSSSPTTATSPRAAASQRTQAAARRGAADQRRRDAPAAAPADAAGVSSRSHRRLRRHDGRLRRSHARRRGATARRSTSRSEMNRLTLSIVGKTLFDADVESQAAEVGEALTARDGIVLDDDAAVRRRARAAAGAEAAPRPDGARAARRDHLPA